MNVKKSEGTVPELSACFHNVMQNLALPLTFHALSAPLATLSLKDEIEKNQNDPFLHDLLNLLRSLGPIFG